MRNKLFLPVLTFLGASIFRNQLCSVVAATIMAMWTGTPAFAASVSYYLDQSNENTFLPDGTNYLKVTISDVGDDIAFLVETLPPLSGNAGTNYGIQGFGFNTSQTLTSSNFLGLPSSGWNVNLGMNLDGFGNFNFVEKGTGDTRVDPLPFSITGIIGDSPTDYVQTSTGTAGQGNVFFAAHVAGFNDVDPGTGVITSAYFGGSTAVPLPAAAWLFGSGLLGLGALVRRRKQSK